jgi:hypothetical protein
MISHDCKLDVVTIQGNLTGDQYIRDVLQPVVVPHFDNHPLATRPVYMDDNARHDIAEILLKVLPFPMQCCFQLTNVLHRRFPSQYTMA